MLVSRKGIQVKIKISASLAETGLPSRKEKETMTTQAHEEQELMDLTDKVHEFSNRAADLTAAIHRRIHNMADLVKLVIIALVIRAHVLIEGVPGIAKTALVKAFQKAISGVKVGRIQGTPDLMPSDIFGRMVYNRETGKNEFEPGPIFVNILLIDEINRMLPETQAALLEAMQEGHVTVGGVTRYLPVPFIVLATENPLEHEGVYPLPQAELDRFAFKVVLDSVKKKEDFLAIMDKNPGPGESVGIEEPVMDVKHLLEAHDMVARIGMSSSMEDYIAVMAEKSHELEGIKEGVSPRGPLFMRDAVKVLAMMEDNLKHAQEDADYLAFPIYNHRLIPDDAHYELLDDMEGVVEQVVKSAKSASSRRK